MRQPPSRPDLYRPIRTWSLVCQSPAPQEPSTALPDGKHQQQSRRECASARGRGQRQECRQTPAPGTPGASGLDSGSCAAAAAVLAAPTPRQGNGTGPREPLHGRPLDAVRLEECDKELRERPHPGVALRGPAQRSCGLVPVQPRDVDVPSLVARALPVVLDELERAVLAAVHLHLERAPGEGAGVLHQRGQRQHGAAADEGRQVLQSGMPVQVQRPPVAARGAQLVPEALRQVDLLAGVVPDHRRRQDSPVHPLRGHVRHARVVGEVRGEGAHPELAPPVHRVGERVVVREQAVPQLQGAPHDARLPLPEEPRPVGGARMGGVHAHRREEDAELVPPREERGGRAAVEAPDVARHVGGASEGPVQHRARRPGEVLPRGGDVASPDRGPEARHAGGEGAVERVETPVGVRARPEHLDLRDVPPVVREVLVLALVVPPEVDAVVQVARVLAAVPPPHGGLFETDPAPAGIRLGTSRRRHPAIGSGHLQVRRVAEPRLPDAAHANVEVAVEGRQLLPGPREDLGVVPEVVVPGLAPGREVVVRLVGKPLKVHDDRVEGEAARAECRHRSVDVGGILPAPARGHEAKGVERRHARRTGEPEVGPSPLGQGLRRHQVELERAMVGPGDAPPVLAPGDGHRIVPGGVDDPECGVAVGGPVVRHVRGAVHHRGRRRGAGEAHCVAGRGSSAVQLPAVRVQREDGLHPAGHGALLPGPVRDVPAQPAVRAGPLAEEGPVHASGRDGASRAAGPLAGHEELVADALATPWAHVREPLAAAWGQRLRLREEAAVSPQQQQRSPGGHRHGAEGRADALGPTATCFLEGCIGLSGGDEDTVDRRVLIQKHADAEGRGPPSREPHAAAEGQGREDLAQGLGQEGRAGEDPQHAAKVQTARLW
mmetsp:Transcript_55622/g.165382  ORF Transcript_55622/g.165382 Transcript_55622/m.165382 type:complete len:890 (-) Transcript_55622:23-2692(-)